MDLIATILNQGHTTHNLIQKQLKCREDFMVLLLLMPMGCIFSLKLALADTFPKIHRR